MSITKEQKSDGIGVSLFIFLIFLTLKITNQIDWSWWWVTSPLWLPTAIVIGMFLLFMAVTFLFMILATIFK